MRYPDGESRAAARRASELSKSAVTNRQDDIRVALVGYGLAGRIFHGRLLAATAGMHVVAIVTANPVRQAEARGDFPAARVLARGDELWNSPEQFDMVVVATGTQSHVSIATSAMQAGKPVVVEKPIAPSAAQARQLVELAAAQGVLLVPFHNRRWDSDHLTLQRLLNEGALGWVLRHESRFDRWRPDASTSWREQLPPAEGGGLLLDLGVHLVDQALLLYGPAMRVYAEVFSRRGGADDDVFLSLHHAAGVTSHLWANTLAAAAGPRLRVLGTNAAYVVDHPDGQEDALRAGRRPDAPDFGMESPERWGRVVIGEKMEAVPSERGSWTNFYIQLRDCIRREAAPPVQAADAVAGLDVLDAARVSARTGGVVDAQPFHPYG